MKRTLLALPLTLLMAAAAPAFANTGNISFIGNITSATCSIQIVDPITGQPGNGQINIGTVAASRFTAPDQEVSGKDFALRFTPGSGCSYTNYVANVTFTGAADSSGQYFKFKSQNGSVTNVVAVLKDNTGTVIENGKPSVDYPLSATVATDMKFSVMFRSTDAVVTPGSTEADVGFSVAIN